MAEVSEVELLEVFAAALRIDAAALSLDSSRDTLPAWDSLGHVMAMLAVEQRWGVQLPLAELERARSLRQVKAAVEALLPR